MFLYKRLAPTHMTYTDHSLIVLQTYIDPPIFICVTPCVPPAYTLIACPRSSCTSCSNVPLPTYEHYSMSNRLINRHAYR